MTFIEALFGLSPDGGSGTLELLVLLAPFLAVAILRWYQHRSKR